MNDTDKSHGWQPDPAERDRLLRMYRDGIVEPIPGPPAAAVIWDAVTDAAPSERRQQVIDALATDPDLELEWRLAQALERERTTREAAESPASGATEGRVTPAANDNRRPWIAVAATVAGLIAAGFLTTLLRPASAPVYRSGQNERTIEASVESATSCSPDLPCRLAWVVGGSSKHAGGSFDITVLTQELEPILESSLDRPFLELTAELLRAQVGRTLLWQVALRTQDEGELLTSPTFSLSVVGNSTNSSSESGSSDPDPNR